MKVELVKHKSKSKAYGKSIFKSENRTFKGKRI
jgi:hypothetical protein